MTRQTRIWIAIISAIAAVLAAVVQITPALLATDKTKSQSISEHPINLPFALDTKFYPTGWFGDGEYNVRLDGADGRYVTVTEMVVDGIDGPISALQIQYQAGPKGWAGIYWQFPENNWANQPGHNLTGIRQITFLAYGETGSEIVEFKAGGIRGEFADSFDISLGKRRLSKEWTSYTIDLSSEDASNVVGAFAWIATGADTPVTFYIAELTAR